MMSRCRCPDWSGDGFPEPSEQLSVVSTAAVDVPGADSLEIEFPRVNIVRTSRGFAPGRLSPGWLTVSLVDESDPSKHFDFKYYTDFILQEFFGIFKNPANRNNGASQILYFE